jgi:hypothetical protein
MNRYWLASGLLLMAIGASSAGAPPPKLSFSQCGIVACPAGFHVVSRSCNLAQCGSTCPNQTVCVPNRGTWFTQCGLEACPAGFHASSQSCNLNACGKQCPNQTVCVRH